MAETKMNPEIKARWVAALRSGAYKQGEGRLHSRDECFCCLGVLSDLAIKDGVGEWQGWDDRCYTYRHPSGEHPETGLLPAPVSEWAGFGYPARMGGKVVIGGDENMLASHNDSGVTFAEIADAIEAQL